MPPNNTTRQQRKNDDATEYVGNVSTSHANTGYHYEGLLFNIGGRGLLGLSSVTATDSFTGRASTNGTSQWDTQYLVPSKTFSRTAAGSYVSLTEDSLNFTAKPCNNYLATLFRKTETDYYGNVTTTSYTYDADNGTLLTEATTFGGTDTRKSVAYSGYVQKGGRYLPQTVTLTQYHEDDTDEFESVTEYSYDNKGRVTSETRNAGTGQELTTTYTYDAFGNVTSTEQDGYEVPTLTRYRQYDSTKRFLTREYTSASPTPDIRYTHDTWGNVLTESDCTAGTGSMALTTTHTYDGWGRLRETTAPHGGRSRTTWGWATQRTWFKLEQATHTPWKKTTFDSRGLETMIQSIGAKDVQLRTVKSYDSRGNLTAQTDIKGNSTLYTHYSYDALGRMTEDNCWTLNRITSYTYGNRSVTATTDGKSYTKTYDEAGLLRTSADPVSSVTYTYNSQWKPSSVTSGNATVTMEYDEAGNQTLLTDPDAGTITYDYDALGRVITQTDARNVVTETCYDALGNVTQTECGGIATNYTYGQSGWATLKPTTISNGTDSTTLSYCKYGLRSKRQYVGGLDELDYYYTYTSDGLIRSDVYPTGMQLFCEYDSYGNRVSKKTLQLTQGQTLGNDGSPIPASAQTIWQLDSVSGTYSVANFLRSTLLIKEEYNVVGLVTRKRLYAGSTQKSWQSYTYDNKTGNLLSRNVMGGSDTFTYDNIDRLVTFGTNTVEYAANGNITSKTGIGDYTYSVLTHPHAVTSVENNAELISASLQTATYNAFGKADMLSLDGNAKVLTILYGPDRERWKSEYRENGSLRRTVLYGDNYERVTQNDTIRHYLYLGDGILCIQNANLRPRYYFMETDHQGSVVQIWSDSAEEVFMAIYDAWGNSRVFLNSIGFQRGYTGHEMLPEFGLINMNGRMYDPLLGRFLSPDNYVQMPDFSQNFNRYSYCLNNPLKYLDPDGEWFGIDDLIVAGISFFTGYVSSGISTGHWGWSSVKGGLISAGMGWLGYNMPGLTHSISSALNFSMSSAINTAANSYIAPITIPFGNHFSLSFSPLFGFSSSHLSIGLGTSFSYINGDFNLQSGFGIGSNYYGWNVSSAYDGWGAGYGKTYYESGDFHGNNIGKQTVGNLSFIMRSVSFRISNDLWGDHKDRWRTTAAELAIGKFSIGTFVDTNYGSAESGYIVDENGTDRLLGVNRKRGAWKCGKVFIAPLWIGYEHKGGIYRIGYSHPFIQSLTQNVVHKYITPTPFFNNYSDFENGIYVSLSRNNPFSMWNH